MDDVDALRTAMIVATSKLNRARGLAQAISTGRDDMDPKGVREIGAEIDQLLGGYATEAASVWRRLAQIVEAR